MRLSRGIQFASVAVLAVLLNACAVGNKYSLSDVKADFKGAPSSVKTVVVSTSDQREVVKSGECAPTYIGMQRGGFGNPFRVNTESGLPLADDLTYAVSESLTKKGFKAMPVYTKVADDSGRVLELIKGQNGDRSLLFVITKWESDTYMNIGVDYDIELTVYDRQMAKLASASVKDSKNIAGSFWNPPEAARQEVPLAFKLALENLLNAPNILQALQDR
jgi:hypothetical protein